MADTPAAAADSSWTVQSLLAATTKFFQKKAIESPQKEARLLLAHVLGCTPIDVIVRSADTPTDDERARYRDIVKRRSEGCPVAYLTGHKPFYLLDFHVAPGVLIPRPDTETLVLHAEDVLKLHPTGRVLDLGTGSGCIAICLAHKFPGLSVDAVDVSPDALVIARQNAQEHGVAKRVRFLQGDWLTAVALADQYDLIVTNPPYLAPEELPTLAVDVREYEPHLALVGGADGLDFYRKLAQGAQPHLKPRGHLLMEIGSTQAEAVQTLFGEVPGWEVLAVHRDLARRPRVVAVRKSSPAEG